MTHRSWLSGVHGANFKLAMPATLKLGDHLVRGAAQTVYEVTDTSAEVVTPAGTFTNCLRHRIDRRCTAASKVFAPGLGLVQDGQFTLVKIARTTPKNRAAKHRLTAAAAAGCGGCGKSSWQTRLSS